MRKLPLIAVVCGVVLAAAVSVSAALPDIFQTTLGSSGQIVGPISATGR